MGSGLSIFPWHDDYPGMIHTRGHSELKSKDDVGVSGGVVTWLTDSLRELDREEKEVFREMQRAGQKEGQTKMWPREGRVGVGERERVGKWWNTAKMMDRQWRERGREKLRTMGRALKRWVKDKERGSFRPGLLPARTRHDARRGRGHLRTARGEGGESVREPCSGRPQGGRPEGGGASNAATAGCSACPLACCLLVTHHLWLKRWTSLKWGWNANGFILLYGDPQTTNYA